MKNKLCSLNYAWYFDALVMLERINLDWMIESKLTVYINMKNLCDMAHHRDEVFIFVIANLYYELYGGKFILVDSKIEYAKTVSR